MLVVEELIGAMRSAEERNLYSGFKVGKIGLSVSLLQVCK
jgi:hypothetical protein